MYPIVSLSTGAFVAGTTVEGNADTLAASLNKFAGEAIVRVGDPIPLNPSYSKDRDPERVMLTALREAALSGAVVVASA